MSKPRPEDMRVGKPEPYALGKDFDDWDFTFKGYAGTLDPAYPALLKTARQSPTVVMATPRHCNIAVPPHDAHTERSTESGEKSWKQWFRTLKTTVPDVRNVRSGRQHGTIRANSDCVEELYSAPHIHEQMTTSYYGYDNIMLEHNAMNNMNNITHMDAHNTQY